MGNHFHEEIEHRAYALYEQRGRQDGHDWDDWFQAEREIRGADAERLSTEAARSGPRRRRANQRHGLEAQS
jgi:hypothetical protein